MGRNLQFYCNNKKFSFYQSQLRNIIYLMVIKDWSKSFHLTYSNWLILNWVRNKNQTLKMLEILSIFNWIFSLKPKSTFNHLTSLNDNGMCVLNENVKAQCLQEAALQGHNLLAVLSKLLNKKIYILNLHIFLPFKSGF